MTGPSQFCVIRVEDFPALGFHIGTVVFSNAVPSNLRGTQPFVQMETIVYYPKHVYPPIRLHGVMAQKPMVAYEFPFCMRIRQLMNACKHMILAYRAIELVHLIFLCIKRSPVPKYRTSFVYLSCTDRTFLLKCLWYSQFDRTNDNGSKDGMNKCL